MYQKIKKMYLYYYPFSEEKCRKKAVWVTAAVFAASAFFTTLFFHREPLYLAVMLSILLSYFLYRELFYQIDCHEGRKAKEIYCKVLMNIAHQYYRCNQVAEAVYHAAEGMPVDTKRNLRRMYEILNAEDRQSEIDCYEGQVKNRFYRILLMQAAAVEEHGDEAMYAQEGNSVFLWSLGNLRLEAELEQRNEQRMQYLLSGLGFVLVVPFFAVPAIHRWAVGNLAELAYFYDGIIGRSFELTAYAMTFLLYELLNDFRGILYEPVWQRGIRRVGKLALFEKLFDFRQQFFGEKRKKHEEMLKRTGDERTIREFFLHQCFCACVAVILCVCLYILYLRYGVGKSVVWLPVFVGAAFLGGKYPVLRLWQEQLIGTDKRKEEVLRFQFLIRLEKKLPGMTSLELLEHLTHNARLFQSSLRECISDYGLDEGEAFLALWQKETYPPFQKLVDMFMMAEEIGVEDAFAEIDVDIGQFLENQKLEMEITQQRRADVAVLFACIPGIFLLFGYLILPFMVECFKMLDYYNGSLTAV